MNDGGIFVRLSLKDVRSSGQQYSSVCPEGARASAQGNVGFQLLLQQPAETHHDVIREESLKNGLWISFEIFTFEI